MVNNAFCYNHAWVSSLTFSTKIWAFYSGTLYDLTNYVHTLGLQQGTLSKHSFLDPDIVSVFMEQPGQDITKSLNSVMDGKDLNSVNQNLDCMKNAFSLGGVDFHKSAWCQVQNDMLLAFTIIVVTSMVLKCESTHFLSSAF
jgi:chitin synthase